MRALLVSLTRGVAAVLIVCAAAALGEASQSMLRSWRDGPVGGLLSDDQYRQFGELKTDDERRAFIDRFWSTLEADAGAAPDSFRKNFESRCEIADVRFGSGGRDGWRTDRGRVFLALGEPETIRRDPGGVDALEKESWSYRGSGGTDPPLQFVFYRCDDGSYRLDPSCALQRDGTSVAYDTQRADFIRQHRDNSFGTGNGPLSALNRVLLPVPGGVPGPRPSETHRGGQITSSVAPGSPPGPRSGVSALDSATYFFRAQDGSVLTLLALELMPQRKGDSAANDVEAARYSGAASLEETGRRGEDLPGATARSVELGPPPLGGQDATTAFFGRVYLEAGRTYAVRYAVKNESKDELFLKEALVGVPDLGGGFSASSIVPAEDFGPAGPDAGRFRIGSEEVVPKAGGVFRRSELLRLYLQVYDAAIDPVSSAPRVDVVFRFYRSIKGAWKRQGKPFSVRGATGASMGVALPIGDWPPGPYRVAVELHDRVAEARTTAEGRFSVAAD